MTSKTIQWYGHSTPGFRKGRSCGTQLLGFVDEVSEALEQGYQEDLPVFDFSKAFDPGKVSHSLVTHKLRHYGISRNINTWIQNFLSDRKQSESVVVNGSSFLGTALEDVFPPPEILHSPHDPPPDNSGAQLQTSRPLTPGGDPGQGPRRHTHQGPEVGPTYLQHHQKGKPDTRLCAPHIKVPGKTIKTAAYRALVCPTLEYASYAWDPHTTEDTNTIEKVQRRAACWVSHRFRQTSSVDDMLLDLEWPTLQARRRRARITMFYKVHNSLAHVDSKHLPSVSRLSHITRKSHPMQYDIPSNRTQYRQMTFFPRTMNNLPTEAATAPSLAAFQARVANL
ncbi:uncharacterized protein LOC143275755 [Babylonia areolata]|uniref:uncharacterized protein LOC143275755 n=1 Tax=Babylonia areolata TaxID=304850 RepID=UPI003FD4880B